MLKRIRWSVPTGEVSGVIVLSIVLGTWPLFDPNWCYKTAYCAIVGLGGQLKSHTWGHFKTAHYPVGTSKPHT